jgi:bifunctional polynucleotide phosphatase/kinase
MKHYKILFADLDGTLIKTMSGDAFPHGIWDMKFRYDVLNAIRVLEPKMLFVVSNQGGIEKGYVNPHYFDAKFNYITHAIEDLIKIDTIGKYCTSNNPDDYKRKPNPGMLEDLFNLYNDVRESVSKDECLMIGDASGKTGQFSNSDLKTAENFGIDYMDVEDFVIEVIMGVKKESKESDN